MNQKNTQDRHEIVAVMMEDDWVSEPHNSDGVTRRFYRNLLREHNDQKNKGNYMQAMSENAPYVTTKDFS